jgi:hypothetical protein
MADEAVKTEEQEAQPPVDALWVGTFEASLPDKTALVPGETVVKINAAEAKESDHWKVVTGSPPAKKAEALKSPDGGKD